MKSVAFFIFGIQNLKGGGGAERFFSDFYDQYNNLEEKSFKLYFITDKQSINELNSVGKLKNKVNCLKFKIFSNRFKNRLEFLQLLKIIIRHNIKLIHLPLFNFHYLSLLKKINKLPSFLRPKLIVNISSCYLVPGLQNKVQNEVNTFFPLFNEIEIDGYFSWYNNFCDYINNNKQLFKKVPFTYAITSRYSNTNYFFPEKKENIIVFAARLDEQKRPDWFIKAIRLILNENEDLFKDWKFIICGNGVLKSVLETEAKVLNLEGKIEFKVEGELYKVFNKSKIFVSCQDFENFPSLAMAEAMSSGNAIIARNVGQTNYFLKENENGMFIKPDSAIGLAQAIFNLVKEEKLIKNMSDKSVELMNTVHTFENFVPQIENFWKKIILN